MFAVVVACIRAAKRDLQVVTLPCRRRLSLFILRLALGSGEKSDALGR